jgi:SAM-dependent methyltransferase
MRILKAMLEKNNAAARLFDKHADLYQSKYMDTALYHDSFDRFCAAVERENAAILDLACGPGNVTQYLLQQRPDFKILGLDLAPRMLELAQLNNPGAEFRLLDCRAVGRLEQRFDGVMCAFGLPYLSKEESLALIGDTARLLNPGGAFYISTMEDDYAKSGPQRGSTGEELYMYFHQADYLIAALEENGFRIEHIDRKRYPGADGSPVVDLILLAGR